MSSLNGKVALITGASSGIGAATAIHFASLGCSVAINGRNEDKLAKTSSECLATGLSAENVLVVVGDIAVEEDAVNIVNKTISHFGKLDILVNNAGIPLEDDLETTSLDVFDKDIRTNTRAVFHLIKLCTPYLKTSKGNIVNVSSAATSRVSPGLHSYTMSKAALDHLTKTAARELGKHQVRVNGVNPAAVATPIWVNAGYSQEEVDSFADVANKQHVLNRIAEPMEIAKPIAFLASDDASFITGTNLLVDGGFSINSN